METNGSAFETLKFILRHVRDPERLDAHPWTRSLIVQDLLARNPQLAQTSPGQQLISALADLFPGLKPASPPRRGKRLDPRWGEFGLLAALYFTPFNHGTPFPTSLIDAWARIDPAILHFVYGRPAESLAEEEVKRYELVGGDLEYGSASTLSDWHRKGLQRFTEIILNRERFLARSSNQPSVILEPERAGGKRRPSRPRRALWLGLLLSVLAALGLGGLKAWRIYERGRLLYLDAARLQELARAPAGVETLDAALPLLTSLRADLAAFKAEAQPLLWLGPRLEWVPVHGYDLASAPALVGLGEHLLEASILSVQAARPLVEELASPASTLDPAGLTALLVEAQPRLREARQELDQALETRQSIDDGRLSPRLRIPLAEDLDPLLALADEGLSLATALPGVLGAGSDGPKTYLLLVQNEDELRPTGGFITSVGNLVLHNGQVISLTFEEAGEQEDWTLPYPAAPWQLQEYMNSPVLVLRDANWFADFPTAVLWAEFLYAYTHSHSVDGVIAFDQHFLVMLLGELGPLEVEGAPYPITKDNVIEYMRQAKYPPPGEAIPAGWYRKEFIRTMAEAILREVTGGEGHDWRRMADVLARALAERHLLLQFDDPVITALSARHGWDNAVRAPDEGDFLLVTDTNIGFNKTNAVVEVSLSYDVDLSDLSAPQAALTTLHRNNASQNVPCIHWNTGQIAGEVSYPINRCYWSYLRVYKQAGAELVDASPHPVPGEWLLLGQDVPARVDEVDEELPGVQTWGTLLVVPGGVSLPTDFEFALPRDVLSAGQAANEWIYRLKVRKQPGTLAIPLTIRIHLPPRAVLKSTSLEAKMQGRHLLVETDLRTDVELEVVFSLP